MKALPTLIALLLLASPLRADDLSIAVDPSLSGPPRGVISGDPSSSFTIEAGMNEPLAAKLRVTGPTGARVQFTFDEEVTLTLPGFSRTLRMELRSSERDRRFTLPSDVPYEYRLAFGGRMAVVPPGMNSGIYSGDFRVSFSTEGQAKDAFVRVSVKIIAGLSVVDSPSPLNFGTGTQGDAALPIEPTDQRAASFRVSGDANRRYRVFLPRQASMNGPRGGRIRVTGLRVETNPQEGVIGGDGYATIRIGGDRAPLSNQQTPGAYTGTFPVLLQYQ